MESTSYEVVYIDKFDDPLSAELFRQRMRERFKLSDSSISRMSSGMPVVVKKGVGQEEAERYRCAIEKAGGVCWIQSLGADHQHRERRQRRRRGLLDRRASYRASSILPDRRGSCGRRSTDQRRG